jgi:uncharacterized membrane protein
MGCLLIRAPYPGTPKQVNTMKPLIVLIASFIATTFISRLILNDWNFAFAGNLAMCLMLFLTASGHVLFTKGMAMMIPPIIPWRTFMIYLTGFAELALGVGLLFHSSRHLSGIGLIALFVLLLPANIYAATKHLNLEKATYSGPGPGYLWFRVPLQLLFIGWVIYFSL